MNVKTKSIREMSYVDILEAHRHSAEFRGSAYRVHILSNIVVSPIKEILELALRNESINAVVEIGNYDNIVKDSFDIESAAAVIVFWEIANVNETIASKSSTMSERELQRLGDDLKKDVQLALDNLKKVPLVIFNKFSASLFSPSALGPCPLDVLSSALNEHVEAIKTPNVVLVDLTKCVAEVSTGASVDWRLWNSSRLLYTPQFFKFYTAQIMPAFRTVTGKVRKALIFDCDNTLWEGIVGEDGLDGIGLDPTTPKGRPFFEVQTLALSLRRQGVVLAVCSKNNPEDVDAVIDTHPFMVLRDADFAFKRINWSSKVDNIVDIAKSLNLGLDSVVFVDDSDFEANLVESGIPQVAVMKVPKARGNYPAEFRRCMSLFWSPVLTEEDIARTKLYQDQAERNADASGFVNIDEYLKSLNLVMTVQRNAVGQIQRIAQLTQKTNQFNLTTRRYTPSEIESIIKRPDCAIYTFDLSDRFGDMGTTGLAIVNFKDLVGVADIETFLLSCRVLGRGAEHKFLDFVIQDLRERCEIVSITASYARTAKNAQTEKFYDGHGFTVRQTGPERIDYELAIQDYRRPTADHIILRSHSE